MGRIEPARRWQIGDAAWTEEGPDVFVVSLSTPIRQPLRLTGTARACWEALHRGAAAQTAEEIISAVTDDDLDGRVDREAMVAGVESFFDALAAEGIVRLSAG